MEWIIGGLNLPLPDAKPDKRIYELLKTVDLENLTFADFQGVAKTIYAEQGAEDELRRIVLVNLARLSVKGNWDGLTSGGGGSGLPLLSYSTGLNSSQKTHFISALPPFPKSNLGAGSQNITNKPTFFPFVLPKDLTFASVNVRVATNVIGDDLDFAIYNADSSTGNPTTKVSGSDVTIPTNPAGSKVVNFASDLSLSGGTVYWVGMVKNAASGSFALTSHTSSDGYPQAPVTDMGSYNAARIVLTSTSSSLPTSFTASDYENAYGFVPFVGLVEA